MVYHEDYTHVTSLRIFKTNFSYSYLPNKEEGLFLFHLTKKMPIVISHNGLIEEIFPREEIASKYLNFNLHYLTSKEHIQRLSKKAVKDSKLFVSPSMEILSDEISEYLSTFQFDVNEYDDPYLRTECFRIHVHVHAVQITEYMRNYNNEFIKRTWGIEHDDDKEYLSHETLMNFQGGLINEARLQSARVEIGEEFSEIFGVKVLEIDEDEISCPICLESFLLGMKVAKTPNCIHSFHRDCLIKWLRKSNSCPMCRENCIVTV